MPFLAVERNSDHTREPKSREPAEQVIRRLEDKVRQAVEHPSTIADLEDAQRAARYFEGQQLDAATLAVLGKRNQPETIENVCRKQINRHIKLYRKLRTSMKFVGRNAPVDDALGTAFSHLNREIDQRTDFGNEELQAVKDMLITGIGWMEWWEEDDEDGTPIIRGLHEDRFHIWRDPYSRRHNPNEDARYLIRGKWIDVENAIALWPDKEKELRRCALDDTAGLTSSTRLMDPEWKQRVEGFYVDRARMRLRPFEVWYKRKVKKLLVADGQGTTELDDFFSAPQKDDALAPREVLRTRYVDELWLGIFCNDVLIHHDRSPYTHGLYPFIPYIAGLKKDGQPIGILSPDVLSLQDGINKRRQKALHVLNTRQVKYEETAVRSPAKLAEEMAQPDGHIVVNQGSMNKLEILENADIGQTQLALYQTDKAAFDEVTASSAIDFGEAPGNISSDRGLQRLDDASAGLAIELHDNIRKARRLGTLVKMGLIRQFYDGDRIIQITDDPRHVEALQVTAQQLDRMKQDIADLVIVEEKDFETSRQAQLDGLVRIAPQLAQNPMLGAFYLQLSDLEDKEALGKILEQAAQPPPTEAKVSLSINYGDLTAEEKTAMAARLGWEEVAKTVQETEPVSKQEMDALVRTQTQASKERMEGKRLDLAEAELQLSDLQKRDDDDLKAQTVIAQEQTKREVAKKKEGTP